MTRTFTESSSTGPRENRGAKGRGRAPAGQDAGNAIESSSLQPVDLPSRPTQIHSPKPVEVSPTPAEAQSVDRHEAIARAAYQRAEQRGFTPGFELDDWLEAERELLEKEGATQLR